MQTDFRVVLILITLTYSEDSIHGFYFESENCDETNDAFYSFPIGFELELL